LVDWRNVRSENDKEQIVQEETLETTKQRIRSMPCAIVGSIYFLILLLMLVKARKPNDVYKAPFVTGCQLMYTSDVGIILSSSGYVNENNRERLRLLGNGDWDYDSMCAQICVPHVAARPVLGFVNNRLPFSVESGTCEENGYSDFIIEKTFNAATYSLDVDVYLQYDDDDGGE